jgi:hypothetical protein
MPHAKQQTARRAATALPPILWTSLCTTAWETLQVAMQKGVSVLA